MGTYIIHFDDKPWQDLDDELYYRCFEIPWFSTTKTTISRLTPYTEDSAYAHGYTEAESKYREIRDELEKQAYQRGYEDGYNKHDIEKIRKRGYDKGLDDIGNALRLLLFQYSNYSLQEIFGYDTARAVVEHFEGSEIVARIRCYEGGVKQDVETIRKEAFEKGYSTAVAEQECAVRGAEEKGYQKGLSDAWECARKIFCTSHGELERIFDLEEDDNGLLWVYHEYTASEAIEKIRQYEQKEQFHIGDEFENESGKRFVILKMDGAEIDRYIDEEGKTYCMSQKYKVMRKTGRHFPEIAEVLAKMKETDNG